MSLPKILVTSAGGKTGLQTALQLLEKNYPVRAMVRRNDHRAKRLHDAGAEIVLGNQYSVIDMRQAMQGVQRAYHCAPTAPNGLHYGSVFVIAAYEARLEHVVMLGQWLAHPGHPSLFTREVWLNQETLKLLPETTNTVINVGWFADTYFMVLEPAAQLGLLTMPLGAGDVKKNAPPSNEDIAAVCVGTLIDPENHAGKFYRPTGPELLSPNDIAAVLSNVLGRKVKYQDISEAMFLKALKALRPPMYSEAALTQLVHYAEEYRRGGFAVAGPTDAIREVVGREPETFETIARRVIAERPEAIRSIGNKARAIRNFIKILATRKPDLAGIEFRRDHVLLESAKLTVESNEWRAAHDLNSGHLPDLPNAVVPLQTANG